MPLRVNANALLSKIMQLVLSGKCLAVIPAFKRHEGYE
tara:strand:+ start:190 stop:303 length:114 start_codon:yes stop_codon:yes gene_type:complete